MINIMKGFFFVILILFSFKLASNVFISPVHKLSPSVIKGIQDLKVKKIEKQKSLSASKNIINANLSKKFCFKFSRKISGGFFSPTKTFESILLNKTDRLLTSINPIISNIQFGIEDNGITYVFYSNSYIDKDNDCFVFKVPQFSSEEVPDLALRVSRVISRVEIDKSYRKKVKLNDWVYFYGVAHGNVLIKFHMSESSSAQAIIHLHKGMTQVLTPNLEISHRAKLKAKEIRLMALNKVNLELAKFNFSDYFSNKKLFSKGDYLFLKEKINIKGFKHLIEIKGADEVFLNTSSYSGSFTLINQSYRDYFFKLNNLETSSEICMVNFPVNKEVVETSFVNSNGVQEVDLDLYFLNKSGEISSRVKKGTHQILVAGYHNGAIDYKIKYRNHTVHGQTYCALGTFLIEN